MLITTKQGELFVTVWNSSCLSNWQAKLQGKVNYTAPKDSTPS